MRQRKKQSLQKTARYGIGLCLGAALFLGGIAEGQNLSSQESKTAHKLYTAKCAKCHEFYDPKAYSQPEWDSWMEKMRKKSKLKTEQFDLLSRYLGQIRSESHARKN